MSHKTQPASGGAPRWTYIVGAAVGAAGLVWAIVSHFLSPPQPLSPGPSANPPQPSITVSGEGVAVGQMNGGQINVR